jgi:galactose oxidase
MWPIGQVSPSQNIVRRSRAAQETTARTLPLRARSNARREAVVKSCILSSLCSLATISSVAAQSVPADPAILINRFSSQCISVPNGSAHLGVQMVQLPCRDLPQEQWILQPVSGGYRVVSALNGLCLEVANASTSAGAAIQQATCISVLHQKWTALVTDGSWFRLKSKHSGKCIAVALRDEGTPITQQACGGDKPRWTISASTLPSLWSPKVTFTLVPAAAANLPDGKVLLWSAYGRSFFDAPPGDPGKTYTAIFDPTTGETIEQLVTVTGHDMFCPGTTMLPDGRILVNGGSSSSKTSIFHPESGVWSTSNEMNVPRGYEGNTLLSNGQVLTLGGSWSGGEGNKDAEVWRSGSGWRPLPGVPVDPFIGPDKKGVYRGDNHLWLIAWSGAWVFHAGPSAQMHWIKTKGSGAIVDAGPRGDDIYAMNGNAVVFDKGKILKLGGAKAYDNGPASDSTYVIDISGGPTAPVDVRQVKPLAFPRALSNSVVLPNGKVVVVGGMNVSRVFSDALPIYVAELWDPLTESFTRLAAMKTQRTYHSVALLLPDGRVFVGGGGLCTDNYKGTCNNHPDAEILTPPSLLNANGTPAVRPVITDAPSTAAPGTTITVKTDTAVQKFALIRMSAVTHSVNNDQRRMPLNIAGGSPSAGYRLPIPTNTGVVLPGNYMLFALNAAGRPSVAKVIQIR